jgi:hypothetical protein
MLNYEHAKQSDGSGVQHVLLFGFVVVQHVELEMSGVRGSGLRFAVD